MSYRIGAARLVQDVSLRVEPGKVAAVVGPNGAGKSTLVRLLSGVDLTPTGGDVLLDGRPIARFSPRELARRRALLAQEQTLRADFPAFSVVLMGRSPHVRGTESEHDYDVATAALADMNATEIADRPYTVLSGGEKQRVALARAGAQIWDGAEPGGGRRPAYLLLDEPTNNLDLEHQHVALRRARRWAEAGVGVLVVLHDLNLAAQYADRIVVMHRGRAVAEGRPREVLTPRLMHRVFRTVARVEQHPCFDCPLVVTLNAVEESTEEMMHELYDEYDHARAEMG